MKRSVLLAVAVFTAVVASSSAAELGTLVVGGGEGRLDSDVDGDGDLDGSYFGIGVVQQDGESSGHFVYGMWGNTDVMELPSSPSKARSAAARSSAAPRCSSLVPAPWISATGWR